MASFNTVSYKDGWKRIINKFKKLNHTENVVSRSFFQRNNELFVEFVFTGDDCIVLPQSIIEENLLVTE